MPLSWNIMAFIMGTIFGSFFHTLALRYIDGSIEKNPARALLGSSLCPSCGKGLTPLELVPILGWLVIRGRCRNCGSPVSPLYPLAEITGGFLLVWCLNLWGAGIRGALLYLVLWTSLTITHVDIKRMTIPDSLVAVFFLLGLYPAITDHAIIDGLYGFLVMFSFFGIILLIFPGSFGGGDIKYASVIGFLLGPSFSAVALESALVTGALTGLVYAAVTRKGLRTRIPFGPFLTAGYVIALLWGADLILLWNRFQG